MIFRAVYFIHLRFFVYLLTRSMVSLRFIFYLSTKFDFFGLSKKINNNKTTHAHKKKFLLQKKET